MELKDTLWRPMRGELVVRVYRGGDLVATHTDANLIVDSAKVALANLLGGDGVGQAVADIGFGTDGNGPNPDDTGLTDAYTKPVSNHDYPQAGTVRFHWSLGVGEANGKGIREFGLFAGDGTLIARKTRGVIEKADDISLEGTWSVIF